MLEKQKSSGSSGIAGFGIAMTSLEEVFLQIGMGAYVLRNSSIAYNDQKTYPSHIIKRFTLIFEL